ncbi:MAG: ABC transporter permease subunit [Vicinamibacterales bacterium]
MPIHDQGYRRYRGTRVPSGRAWWVIARAGVGTMLRRRAFVALLALAWLPFVVRAVQIYAATTLPQASFLAPDANLFRDFLEQQGAFLFFVTVYAGSGLIANDRRTNALQIYLSKPMTRLEYVVGKCAVLASLLLFVTWVPAFMLLLVQIAFSGSLIFLRDNLFLFPAITLFSWLQAVTVTLMMLALSSLSKSSRFVGILYAVLMFFSRALGGIVYAVTRDRRLSWISVPADLSRIGDAIFGLPSRGEASIAVALIAIGVLAVGSVYVLQRRVRGVEVVV